MADDKDPSNKSKTKTPDVVLMHGRTDDGEGIRVLRARDGEVHTGELRALKQGVPLSGEVVALTRRPEHPLLWDVDVQCKVESPQATRAHGGPARVASRAYRRNYDAIFRRSEDEPVMN